MGTVFWVLLLWLFLESVKTIAGLGWALGAAAVIGVVCFALDRRDQQHPKEP